MFLNARDTTINKGIRERSIVESLEDHLIKSGNSDTNQFIEISKDRMEDLTILGLGDGAMVTPKPFTHPVLAIYNGHQYLIGDFRTCAKFNKNDQVVKISNPGLFRRETIRITLEGLWITGGAVDILNAGKFQISIYSKWIAEMIARRFGLDPEQQLQIAVLAAFFYICQFSDIDSLDVRRTLNLITQSTKMSVGFIMATLDGLDYISNIEELITEIKERVVTERLAGLELDILISLLAGSWFGANNGVLVGTALEYPPTWCSLLYLSLTESVNRTTGIGKLALRFERDPGCREFLAAISMLLMNNTSVDIFKVRG